jgi:hypothetical protein
LELQPSVQVYPQCPSLGRPRVGCLQHNNNNNKIYDINKIIFYINNFNYSKIIIFIKQIILFVILILLIVLKIIIFRTQIILFLILIVLIIIKKIIFIIQIIILLIIKKYL